MHIRRGGDKQRPRRNAACAATASRMNGAEIQIGGGPIKKIYSPFLPKWIGHAETNAITIDCSKIFAGGETVSSAGVSFNIPARKTAAQIEFQQRGCMTC